MPKEIFFGNTDREGASKHRPSLTAVEVRRAKAICATCKVVMDCLKHAIDNEEEFGVWGGTTPTERLDMALPIAG